MIADEHDASPRRDVLHALARHLEVVAIEDAERRKKLSEMPLGDTKVVDAVGAKLQLKAVNALSGLLGK